jgi:hypothetical protein
MRFQTILFLVACPVALMASDPIYLHPWKHHTIDAADQVNHRAGADGVRLGDLNGDGRLDVVTGWEEGNQIRVALQPAPEKIREPWPAITIGAVRSPEDAVFADLDGDGRLDVVSATEGRERKIFVHWAPAAPGDITDGAAWTTVPFPSSIGEQWWMYTLPLDVDKDGDTDLVIGSKNAGASVTWLRNPGGAAARDLGQWEATRIADAGWIMSLELLEAEGERYLVYSDRKGPASGIHLVPILTEAPWFGSPVLVGAGGEEVMFLDIARYDEDSRVDIIAAIKPQTIRVYCQPEEPAEAWEKTIDIGPVPNDRFGTVKAVKVMNPIVRIDGFAPPLVVTCENAHDKKSGVLLARQPGVWQSISGSEGIKFDRIALLDLDGDGDLDIVTCEETAGLGVVWYENPWSDDPGRFHFEEGANF